MIGTAKAQPYLVVLILFIAAAHAQGTLARVRSTGVLRCAVIAEDAEYNSADDHGPREEFDHALCTAVAVAAAGDGARVQATTYLDEPDAVAALLAGKEDVIASLSKDFSHTTQAGLGFSTPVLYDSLGFLVSRKSGIRTAAQLAGKTVCTLANTEAESSVTDWLHAKKIDAIPFPFTEEGEMEAAFATNNCAAFAGDWTRLSFIRTEFGSEAVDYALLPDTASDDPLAMAYRTNDIQLGHTADWTVQVLLWGDRVVAGEDSTVARRLSGTTRELGEPLGLPPEWASRVLRHTGSYRQIFDKTLGDGSNRKLPRGLNRLSDEGGLLSPLPLK